MKPLKIVDSKKVYENLIKEMSDFQLLAALLDYKIDCFMDGITIENEKIFILKMAENNMIFLSTSVASEFSSFFKTTQELEKALIELM